MESKVNIILIFVGAVALLNSCSAQTAYQKAGLDVHNEVRQIHGSNMMTLDADLNQAAQDCAVYYSTKGKIDHSCKTPGAGENLWALWGPENPDLEEKVKSAIRGWYSEIERYNYDNPGASTGVTGHFTQVVWNASTVLGIGAATVGKYTSVVGKYKPHGNVVFYPGESFWMFYKENVKPPMEVSSVITCPPVKIGTNNETKTANSIHC